MDPDLGTAGQLVVQVPLPTLVLSLKTRRGRYNLLDQRHHGVVRPQLLKGYGGVIEKKDTCSIRAATCDDPQSGFLYRANELEDGVRLPCHASQRRPSIPAIREEATTITTMAVILASYDQLGGAYKNNDDSATGRHSAAWSHSFSRLGSDGYDSKGAHREPAAGLSIPNLV
jgi:hypothetical protein